MEAIKSCRIPVEAPKDLIDAYFEVKKRALDAILSKVKFSGKPTWSSEAKIGGSLEMNF
jgi:hypothetical protein